MFRAKIDNSQKLFTKCIQAIEVVTDEACLNVSQKGVSVKTVDASNTYLIDLSISQNVFLEFNTNIEIQVPVDISKLLQAVEMMSAVIDIEFDDKMLTLGTERLHFNLPLLAEDTIRKPPKIPPLTEGYYKIQLSGFEYKDIIEAVSVVDDMEIWLGVKDNKFFAGSVGDVGTRSVRYEIPNISVPDIKCMFSIQYLMELMKVLKPLDTMRLEIKTGYPLKIFFSLADGVEGMYLIAPRVELD
jgi:DNA polymerase III sliding clamp (beta) subunit (PCNA family)